MPTNKGKKKNGGIVYNYYDDEMKRIGVISNVQFWSETGHTKFLGINEGSLKVIIRNLQEMLDGMKKED